MRMRRPRLDKAHPDTPAAVDIEAQRRRRIEIALLEADEARQKSPYIVRVEWQHKSHGYQTKDIEFCHLAAILPELTMQIVLWFQKFHSHSSPASVTAKRTGIKAALNYFNSLPENPTIATGTTLLPSRPLQIEDLTVDHGHALQHFLSASTKSPLTKRHAYFAAKAAFEGAAKLRGHPLLWPKWISSKPKLIGKGGYSDDEVRGIVRACEAELQRIKRKCCNIVNIETLCPAVILVTARTGWNIQTVLDLSIDDWCEPYVIGEENYWLVRGVKTRPKPKKIEFVSNGTNEFHVYQVIKWVIEQTEPARLAIRQRMQVLQQQLIAGDSTVADELRYLDFIKNRIWVAHYKRQNNMTKYDITQLRTPNLNNYPKPLLEKYKICGDDGHPLKWDSTRLRDSWIEWIDSETYGDLRLTQAAAGHSDSSTTEGYLRNVSQRKKIVQKLWNFGERLFEEISLHRLDPAILRGVVREGRMTTRDAKRLADSEFTKTRWGAYCRDIKAAPHLTAGELCDGESCYKACSNAFWLFESAAEIGGIIADLEALRARTPVTDWPGSDHEIRLNMMREIFAAYSARAQAQARIEPILPQVRFAATLNFEQEKPCDRS